MNDRLTQLGSKETVYPNNYSPFLLETFDNKHNQDCIVEIVCTEFTSICPKTGQPDFGKIDIGYCPDKKLVESKSLKLYLFSFRNHGSFHEDCIQTIAKDLFRSMEPKWIRVRGNFHLRGGIAINPFVSIVKKGYTGREGST